ncbi:MAG: nuclear transport factor 2 family protein, partial [Deltaproteobacteria bacterium]|nr:nuclear transport factor 2 family protein [Deltaproteobacteria bacterium]
KDAQGQEQKLGSGKYFTVWRRQADGAWRIAFDIGNDDPK